MLSRPAFLILGAIGALAASSPTPTTPKSSFVSAKGTGFMVNGSDFRFVGTNAYWLPVLNSDADVEATFANISAANITVVRTWAFNDVPEIPENGTWFQLLVNKTSVLNLNETTGLPKLDRIFAAAQRHGIYILPVLTNNWNPLPGDNITHSPSTGGVSRRDVATNNTLPRNYLSNDYGGIDAYVRAFNASSHDAFYTDPEIIAAFENYTTTLVKRYVNNTNLLAWELANDPRCNSSVSDSGNCTTNTVTMWHSRIATLINATDPNHLISTGSAGFFCANCTKIFQKTIVPPAGPSATPERRKFKAKPLTNKRILDERKQTRKKNRAAKLKVSPPTEGVRIRGRWIATPTRRQDAQEEGVGTAFDGSTGVDSDDILSIPQIGFSSFQLFPDQNTYAPNDPNLSAFNNTLQAGLDWIKRHGESAQMFGKPIVLGGFGLVTQDNAPFFVPFNTTVAPFANDQFGNITLDPNVLPFGVTDAQRDDAYAQWLQEGINSGLAGMIQYQWGQGNLTAVNGTAITPSISESGIVNENTQSAIQNQTGQSPSDGYSIVGQGQAAIQGVLQGAAQQFVPNGP